MKSCAVLLFLALLQLAIHGEICYRTNSAGALVLAGSRDCPISVLVTNMSPSTNVTVGDSITLVWKSPKFSFFDWVGLYAVGTTNVSQFIEREFLFSAEQE